MRNNIILLISASILILSACTQTISTDNATESMTSSTSTGVDIQPDLLAVSHDPVCGMSMLHSKIGDTLSVDGKIYAFCNSTCKKHFAENPSDYIESNDVH